MAKTDFIPLDYDYFDFEGRNYIRIIGRNSSGKRVCVVDSCEVYLWAILKTGLSIKKINALVEKIKKIQLDSKGRKTKVEKVDLQDKNFLGKKVKALKISATNYKDLHEITDHLDFPEIEYRRGYDIGFVTHYINEKRILPLHWYEISGEVLDNSRGLGGIGMALDVDACIRLDSSKEISDKKFSPKILAYDIETDEIKIGEGEILMVSLVSENFKKVITWKKDSLNEHTKNLDYVEYVKDESELLERFVHYVREISPDFLVGYFSDGFDLPYIKSRAQKFRVPLNLGLDDSQPKFSRSGARISTGKISGIIHVDLLRFIQTAYAQYMQSETLSLNEVANEFLGDEKKDFKIRHSETLKDHQWKEYFEYNLHDSVLTYQLFEKFWPDMAEFSKVIQEPVFDLSRAGLSKYVESYILHHLEKYNEIPEKRPLHDEIGSRRRRGPVEGAFVFEPQPGLYEDIAFFDFTSMHTSIIISMNISGQTLLEKPEKDANTIETSLGKFSFTKKQGFIPSLLEDIFKQRKKAKSEYKAHPDKTTLARSNAFKLLSASVHGYIGFFGARYYSKEASAAILAYVRKFNQDTIKEIEQKGFKVVYGDTDSIAFLRGDRNKSEIKKVLSELNSHLPGIMELELEGFFKRGIWVTTRGGTIGAKKKYALLSDDPEKKMKIRGFETVRRDWCALAREVQNNVINLVLDEGNEKSALAYLKAVVKKIKSREINSDQIVIKTMLKKPISEYKAISPHVIAAKRMKELDTPVSSGNLVSYYIAEPEKGKKRKLVRDRVKLPEEKGQYDIQYYLNKQILPAVENIFQVFGIDVKEVIEGKKQTTLGEF